MNRPQQAQCLALGLLSLLTLSACDSDSDRPYRSQAIDGYIVDGSVFCDNRANGVTVAGGWLSCPDGTTLVRVRGGVDTGFDAEAVNSDIDFIGELIAPASLGYVTPLTTLAVFMASTAEGYDDDLWKMAVQNLATVFNQPALDLSADASKDMLLIRLNAQIHQILSAFARSEAEYSQVGEAMAEVLSARASQGAVMDLENDVPASMTAINAALLKTFSPIARSASELDALAIRVQSANLSIAQATTPAMVAAGATDGSAATSMVTIDRSAGPIRLSSSSGFNQDQYTLREISLEDFEDATLRNGTYTTQVSRYLVDLEFDNHMLEFKQDMRNLPVTMAFALKATQPGDNRAMSFVSDDIMLSAVTNQPESLLITLPDNATFDAVGTDSRGTVTAAQIQTDGVDTFSSRNGSFSVNFQKIYDELAELGFEDILDTPANYSMTLIISGLQLRERTPTGIIPAQRHVISVGSRQVAGAGFKGYLSYIR